MKLKVLCVSFISLLVALAVNPANASSSSNEDIFSSESWSLKLITIKINILKLTKKTVCIFI